MNIRWKHGAWAVPLALGLLLPGCSGGNDHGGVQASRRCRVLLALDPYATQVPVQGLDLTFRVPEGVTVAAWQDGALVQGALVAGPDLPANRLLVGRWTPGTREVRLTVGTAPSAAWQGTFAQVEVTVPPGVSTQALGTEAARSCTLVAATGLAPDTRSPLALTPAVRMKVTAKDTDSLSGGVPVI
ncbi:hypothetical protein [Mesoterricola sediminis]|uniref:Uncharacterized protein n=1 Tax=Mesoterricola sediminis TaxID=2927980 RepID=A0AA48KG37_9BACT|nr:hypothetical protein [Mesoterricola sediminis]BDU77048.1 hypothetical protein METESE_20060 [Mesoterricola sediminis]